MVSESGSTEWGGRGAQEPQNGVSPKGAGIKPCFQLGGRAAQEGLRVSRVGLTGGGVRAKLCALLPSPRPFWLSPSQIMVIPVGPDAEEYAGEVRAQPPPQWPSQGDRELGRGPREKG